jgi:hypothetical protein
MILFSRQTFPVYFFVVKKLRAADGSSLSRSNILTLKRRLGETGFSLDAIRRNRQRRNHVLRVNMQHERHWPIFLPA